MFALLMCGRYMTHLCRVESVELLTVEVDSHPRLGSRLEDSSALCNVKYASLTEDVDVVDAQLTSIHQRLDSGNLVLDDVISRFRCRRTSVSGVDSGLIHYYVHCSTDWIASKLLFTVKQYRHGSYTTYDTYCGTE